MSVFVNSIDATSLLHRNSSARNLFFWIKAFLIGINVKIQCIYLKDLSLVEPNDILEVATKIEQ